MRRARVRAPVAAEPIGQDVATLGSAGWPERLCRAPVRALPEAGAGISLMTTDGVRAMAASPHPASAALEGVQLTLGEGASVEAFLLQRPALEASLTAASAGRWPGYQAAAQAAGMRAVFALPPQIGAARPGVLGIHLRSTGALAPTLDRALESQFTVYQAQGMAMVDLGVSLADAMARLQAHAYANDRTLQDAARDIVDGRLRLEPDPS